MTTIEIPHVAGFRFVRYGPVTDDDIGRYVQRDDGTMEDIRIACPFRHKYAIYEKEPKYRDPTYGDIGKVVEVRDGDDWNDRVFAGVMAGRWLAYTDAGRSMGIEPWRHARVKV